MMKQLISAALFLLFFSAVNAQSKGIISGSVTDVNANAIEAATISLSRAKDSAIIKSTATDKGGFYSFENLPDDRYIVRITIAGHQKAYSPIIKLNSQQQFIQIPAIRLIPSTKEMAAVTVTVKRALIEQKTDRTIVNVDASITNIGTSALEVLEKSPGVSVDRDGNISLKGKQGVLIMVDGRPTQLGGADLANLLRNMSSNQLDQIEIMTNPPARYDASGTSGIINVKTKKILTAGINGSASVSYSQGRYPKTAEGFNFNYRNAKINLFTNLSHNYHKRFSTLNIDRNIFNSNANSIERIFNQEANRISSGNSYNTKFGVDFFANQKTTIGAIVNFNSRTMASNNPSITKISNAAKDLESVTNAMVNNKTDWNSTGVNLNFRRLLDRKGKELTADIDYAKHIMQNDLLMVNSYADAAGSEFKKADTLIGNLPQDIKVYSSRIDYLHPISKEARFEAGIKSSIVRTDNNAAYDSIQYGSIVPDFHRSNHFIYEENINAAYLNLSTSLSKKWNAQFGLRIENTNAKGRQITTLETFNRHYTQLFPTAYFQYKANDKNNFGANFGRRVSRPGYQNLNPFIKFIDRYTFSQGNPALNPSVSNNIELSHTWKNQITTTINYTSIKDVIQEIIQQKGQEAYNMPANVSSLTQFGISVNAATPITKWWTGNININLFNDKYKGLISNSTIDRSATSFVIDGTQQFKITKTLTGEINGRYRNAALVGVMQVQPVGFISAGISQQVLKNKGTIRLSARDIFWTQRLKGTTQYGSGIL